MPNDPDDSRLLVAPESSPQSFLFSDEVVKAITAAAKKGQYTAERFRIRHPDKYRAIITLRGQGWSQKRIAHLLGVHHRTIAAVDDAEPEAIDTIRQRLVRDLRRGAALQIDRLIEHPELVPMHVAGLIASQLLDKVELLDGRATSRQEVVAPGNIYDEWEKFLAQQPEKQLSEDQVREIRSVEGKIPAIEAPAGAPGVAHPPDSSAIVKVPAGAPVTTNDPNRSAE